MKVDKLLAGLLIGAAAGAAFGILFAPSEGKETRKKLKKKGQDIGENVKTKINEFGEVIQDRYQSIKSDAKSALSKGFGSSEQYKADAEVN